MKKCDGIFDPVPDTLLVGCDSINFFGSKISDQRFRRASLIPKVSCCHEMKITVLTVKKYSALLGAY
jgi:hypothetical protein